jgi:hypothetical protein
MEDVLDTLLMEMNAIDAYVTFDDLFKKYRDKQEFQEVLTRLDVLKKEGYIETSTSGWRISIKGKMFLSTGGYAERKKKEIEAHEGIIAQTKFAKRGYLIAIFAIVITIISLVLQFIDLK